MLLAGVVLLQEFRSHVSFSKGKYMWLFGSLIALGSLGWGAG